MTTSDSPILRVSGLKKNFGGLLAMDGVDFAVNKGQIKGLIGPNGAGKTTTLNIISGSLKPAAGQVVFEGIPVTGLSPDRIARRGIARTFQNVLLFNRLTVLENILCGSLLHARQGLLGCCLGLPGVRKAQAAALHRAAKIAHSLDLDNELHRPAKDLPLAKQRAVEIARAIATEPRLILLDEPGAGLTREEGDKLANIIRGMQQENDLSILMVDHNMPLVTALCQEIAVINFGRIIADGSCADVVNNQAVRDAYLGEKIAACS